MARIDRHRNTGDIDVVDLYALSEDRQEAMRFYNNRLWRKCSKYHLACNPLCAMCGHPATHTDHVIERRMLPPEAWYEPTNLQSLCTSCHSTKTHRGAKRKPVERHDQPPAENA